MKKIDDDIKNGSFASSYLIYGNESYLKRFYTDKLMNALGNKDDSMNTAIYNGKDFDAKAVVDLAYTVPFFANRRVILIKGCGYFKSSAPDELVDYIKAPSEDTVIVFEEDEVDKKTRLYKAIKEKGYVSEINTPDERTLLSWMKSYFKNEGKSIADADLFYMLERIGPYMDLLRKESEKVVSYVGDATTVTRADIEQITNKTISSQIFDMTDAIAAGNLTKAMSTYSDLIAMKEAPLYILFMITKMFKQLYEVKTYTGANMESALGIHPYVAKKYISIARSYSAEELRQAVEYGAKLETDVKSGKLTDNLSVELFIVRMCRGTKGK